MIEAAWFGMTRGQVLLGFTEDGRGLYGKFSSWAEPRVFLLNFHRATEDLNVFELPGTRVEKLWLLEALDLIT